MTDIQGRTAFITGGGNGIGLGIARSFARAGAKLALADLDDAALARAKEELRGVTSVETFAFDVRDREAYASAAEAAESALGPVSLLVSNAGIAGYGCNFVHSHAFWDWYIGVNLQGVINGLVAFLPKMIERGRGGHIVNVSSGAGLVASRSGALYNTPKFAVVGMSEELSLDPNLISAGIGISVFCPAYVATDIVPRTVAMAYEAGGPLAGKEARPMPKSLAAVDKIIHDAGVGIDFAGDRVLKAVRENALYIHTDRTVEEALKLRTAAILEALPD